MHECDYCVGDLARFGSTALVDGGWRLAVVLKYDTRKIYNKRFSFLGAHSRTGYERDDLCSDLIHENGEHQLSFI